MADVSLNGLKVKTDSLPNDWYVSLINPQSGEPAEIMTVARFVELFTSKQPEVTELSKGLMSPQNLKSNPSNARVNRKILNVELIARKAFRVRKKSNDVNFNIKILGGWTYGNAFGVIEKVISYYSNGNITGTKVYKCSNNTCGIFYISDPYKDGDYICVDIVNKYTEQSSAFAVILESYYTLDSFEFTNDQTPRSEDLTKNNRDETEFALKTSAYTLAASPNALTDTISDNYSILPPPANCVPNYSESAGSDEQFAISAMSETDNQDGSIPVRSEPNEVQEQYVWSIDKIGRAVLELQAENKKLKQILNISDDSEVQQM